LGGRRNHEERCRFDRHGEHGLRLTEDLRGRGDCRRLQEEIPIGVEQELRVLGVGNNACEQKNECYLGTCSCAEQS
jgi:hypothetical protein